MITDLRDNTCNITKPGMLMRNDTAKSFLKQGDTIPGRHNPRETQSQDQPGLKTTACKCWLWNFTGSCPSLTTTGNSVLHSQAEGWYLHHKNPTTNDVLLVQILPLPCKNQLFKQNIREQNPLGNVSPSTPLHSSYPRQQQCLLPASTADS